MKKTKKPIFLKKKKTTVDIFRNTYTYEKLLDKNEKEILFKI